MPTLLQWNRRRTSQQKRRRSPTPSRFNRERLPLLFRSPSTLTRTQQTQWRTQLVVTITAATALLILIIGAAGFYINDIRYPRLPIATVNGATIQRDTWLAYKALLQAEINQKLQKIQSNQPSNGTEAAAQQAQISQLQRDLQNTGQTAANDLINFLIINDNLSSLEKAGTPASTLIPSAKQISAALAAEKEALGVTTQSQLDSQLQKMNMSQGEFHQILVDRQTIQNVKNSLNRDVKPVQPQVRARIMIFPVQATAQKALSELKAGKSWGDVNLQYARDPSAKETSQVINWTPASLHSAAFDNFAFKAAPLQISPVVPDNGAYDIIQVMDAGRARPLTLIQQQTVKEKIYTDWLAKQTAHATVQRFPTNMSG
ncbi:MAG: hypothetical protein M1396_07265 [Chloroflexi bacterium]|nr:hypothetical protein [Chloroflexota bacterium]